MQFVIDQYVYTVLLGKSINRIVLVLPYTPHQIAGYSDIKRTVTLAGKNVNTRLLWHIYGFILCHKNPSFLRRPE